MTLCKSRARNDVVWDVGPGSYTTSYLGPSRGNAVFAGRYHRADTTEVLLLAVRPYSKAPNNRNGLALSITVLLGALGFLNDLLHYRYWVRAVRASRLSGAPLLGHYGY